MKTLIDKDPAMMLNAISHLKISIDRIEHDPKGILNSGNYAPEAGSAAPYHAKIVLAAAKERLAQMEEEYRLALAASTIIKKEAKC